MDTLEKVNEEVFISRQPVVCWGGDEVAFLKKQVLLAPRGRTRICAHKSSLDNLHEMLIAVRGGCYIQPHKHLEKNESFHIVEGFADVVIFTESGDLAKVIRLGEVHGPHPFFYRLPKNLYHTVVVRSDVFVFHEITEGPFDPSQTIQAPFSPDPAHQLNAQNYLDDLSKKIKDSHPETN